MSFWQLYYHFVWATKNREPILDDERAHLFTRSVQALCTEEGVIVHAIGVMPDHVHLALSVPPRLAIATFAQRLKGTTSRCFNTTAARPDLDHFDWQPEYGVLSFGARSLDDVVGYVNNQQSHHARDELWSLYELTERPYQPATAD